MIWHEEAGGLPLPPASETSAAASISDTIVHNPPASWKPSDPGAYGLAISIGALPTSELREMVQLLTTYGPAFGFHGRRRRDIAMRELQRRSAVQNA